MWHKFSGHISGSGLSPTTVQGEIEEVTGLPVPPRRAWIAWTGQHQFQVGEVYRLTIGDRSWEVAVVGFRPGPVIELVTTS